jgi:hypothetical protein
MNDMYGDEFVSKTKFNSVRDKFRIACIKGNTAVAKKVLSKYDFEDNCFIWDCLTLAFDAGNLNICELFETIIPSEPIELEEFLTHSYHVISIDKSTERALWLFVNFGLPTNLYERRNILYQAYCQGNINLVQFYFRNAGMGKEDIIREMFIPNIHIRNMEKIYEQGDKSFLV